MGYVRLHSESKVTLLSDKPCGDMDSYYQTANTQEDRSLVMGRAGFLTGVLGDGRVMYLGLVRTVWVELAFSLLFQLPLLHTCSPFSISLES